MIRNLIVAVFLSLSFGVLAQAAEILTHEEYEAIKDVSIEIISKFPPEKYVYVGVGRSPTPIMAFLELKLGSEAIVHLPLGGMNEFTPDNMDIYTDSNKYLIDQYINRILSNKITDGKKFVFIDIAIRGLSLINVKREIERSSPQSEFLAITHPDPTSTTSPYPYRDAANIRALNKANIPYVDIPPFLFQKFAQQDYDDLSKYASYKVTDGKEFFLPRTPKLNPKQYWNNLVDIILKNMRSDTITYRTCSGLF